MRYSAEIAAGRLTILNCAISKKRGVLPFYVNTVRPEWSSTVRDFAARGYPVAEVLVEMVRPEDVFAAFGTPSYAKIDIEGEDGTVLRALGRLRTPPPFVSFEMGAGMGDQIIDELVDAGYTIFSIVDQRPNYQRSDIRLESASAYPDHGARFDFRRGSSGYAGDRLMDVPLSADILKAWLRWFKAEMRPQIKEANQAGREHPFGTWFDIHARLSSS